MVLYISIDPVRELVVQHSRSLAEYKAYRHHSRLPESDEPKNAIVVKIEAGLATTFTINEDTT